MNSNETKPVVEIKGFNLWYGDFKALIDVNISFLPNRITALIGPSGCGKSTLLRSINRMNDLIPGVRKTGTVLFEGKDVYSDDIDVCLLRKKIGMVFQRPNPFPLSIFENVAFGLRVSGVRGENQIKEIVEKSLQDAWLWDNVKDKLYTSALELPLDQQQRLCIARLLAVKPDVILLDEPCSALDPIATAKIENLVLELKKKYTIIIVTHNMQQAARISDYTGYMLLGELVEFDETTRIFTNPGDKRTLDYVSGRYG